MRAEWLVHSAEHASHRKWQRETRAVRFERHISMSLTTSGVNRERANLLSLPPKQSRTLWVWGKVWGGVWFDSTLKIPVAPIGPVHVLQIGDARTLRARRVGRTKRRSVLVANAVGSDLEQLLAPLGVGGERIDVRIPWL